jgi:hypothetical protein
MLQFLPRTKLAATARHSRVCHALGGALTPRFLSLLGGVWPLEMPGTVDPAGKNPDGVGTNEVETLKMVDIDVVDTVVVSTDVNTNVV